MTKTDIIKAMRRHTRDADFITREEVRACIGNPPWTDVARFFSYFSAGPSRREWHGHRFDPGARLRSCTP